MEQVLFDVTLHDRRIFVTTTSNIAHFFLVRKWTVPVELLSDVGSQTHEVLFDPGDIIAQRGDIQLFAERFDFVVQVEQVRFDHRHLLFQALRKNVFIGELLPMAQRHVPCRE